MAEFGGWTLPMQYSSIREEHMAVRENAGIFDVSHMGRFRFTGKDAFPMLDKILPRNLVLLLGKQKITLSLSAMLDQE